MNIPYVKDIIYDAKPELKLALFSDLHIGAEDCDLKTMRRDLATSADENRRISINGDVAELIVPSDRKRFTASKLLSHRDDVINETLELAFKELKPFADYIDVIGTGNHEEAPIKYNSFDFIGALIVLLNRERAVTLPPIHRAAYQGYMQYKLKPSGKRSSVVPFTIYHHHGAGGSAPVTKGMIDFNRMIYSHIADLYWMGHKHTAIQDNGIVRDRLNQNGGYVQTVSKAVITPGYKTHEIDSEPGYRLKYSDGFYNMQAKGYGVVDLYVDRMYSTIDHFEVTLRT